MKKALQIFVTILALSILFTMTACSNYGKIQKAYEEAGWTVIEQSDEEKEEYTEGAEEEGIKIISHFFKSDDLIPATAYILEFDCSKDEMVAYINDNAVLLAIVGNPEESDKVNGNCVYIPSLSDAVSGEAFEIFKKA